MLTLLFNQFRRLLASVGFTVGADASFTARVSEEASLVEGGIGAATVTAHTLLRAQVAFAAVATMSVAAHVVEEASLADAGVGVFAARAGAILRSVVAFVTDSVFAPVARLVMRASASFGGTADMGVASLAPPAPTLGGGGGTSSRIKSRKPRIAYRTSVAFRAEGIFAARAHVVPAAVPELAIIWPPFEEAQAIEQPFEPAIAGHIAAGSGSSWTEEEELVALLMFAEAA